MCTLATTIYVQNALVIPGSFQLESPAHRGEVVTLFLNMAVCTASARSTSTQSREHPTNSQNSTDQKTQSYRPTFNGINL